ncbi:hypothetical protein BDW02DRAFT_574780 [Decorospora gaudefroyi]|uniref:Uncharacterized protein n=1 Tax=Decorospora gaudefroyi TaxID=184978 RepID=A0A6A5JVV8_9PLEO|nr:hypothetical protein BDW02DRAFT_574780 [Decorospora gaudefroyi]
MPIGDTTSLFGTIGTWLGVGLAFIALVGIVGPWLALSASRTQRQRAMNQLQDRDQDYVTKGFGIGLSHRYLRRVRVPNLFNYYAIRIPEAGELWTLHSVKSTSCRTGWARLCRLLEAYKLPMQSKTSKLPPWLSFIRFVYPKRNSSRDMKTEVSIIYDKSGSLHFEGRHTWLPVSRYWILSIGLLGRYGKRLNCGRGVNTRTVRPDLEEERVLLVPDAPIAFDSDIDLPGYSHRTRNMTEHWEWRATMSSADDEEFEEMRHPGVYGKTGEFETLNPTNAIPCAVFFRWHNQAEMDLDGPRKETLTLLDLYWLANGFLPVDSPGKARVVVQLTDSAYWMGGSLAESGLEPLPRTYEFYSLQIALDRPKSMRMAVEALGGLLTPLYTWQKVPIPDLSSMQEEECKYLQGLNPSFATRSQWVQLNGVALGVENSAFFDRRDLQTLTLNFLRLRWDDWGYLIHRSQHSYWFCLLNEGRELMETAFENFRNGVIAGTDDIPPGLRVIDPRVKQVISRHQDMYIENWDDGAYTETDMKVLVGLDRRLKETHHLPEFVQEALCVLIMTNPSFRDAVKTLIRPASAIIREVEEDTETDVTWDLVLDIAQGQARWRQPVAKTFEFERELFDGFSRIPPYHISATELAMAALRIGVKCDIWMTSLDGRPLIEFVRQLDRLVYVA